MLKINKLLKFINKNENWKELIQKEPYNIIVKENGEYTLLKYNQLESDFNSAIVCSCRGIILNKENKIVCFPFYKFFNYAEPQADKIDWISSKVQEKIDGSLIKVWYDKEWHVSTNGCINAFEAKIKDTDKTYGDLFAEVFDKSIFERLNKDNTYMFELVSPEAQIVVYYDKTKIYHIGTRNNKTYKEVEENIGIEKPKTYNFETLEKIIENTNNLSKNEEGYVVVDKNYNRIKIKSKEYLMAHYLVGNCNFTDKRIMQIIKMGEEREILSYFPEYTSKIDNINKSINKTIAYIYNNYAELLNIKERNEYVNTINGSKYFHFLIKLFDNPNLNVKLEILKLPVEEILEVIE